MKFKRYICVLLIILSVFSVAASAEAAADTAETTEENDKLIPTDYVIPQDEEMTLRSRYAMLYSEYDKRVLFSKRADELVEPASTTKIMVGIMIFEKYGNQLDTQITVTEKLLADKEGLSIYLEPGETLTIRQLLTVLLMHGANDVSTILAHYYMQDISKGDDLLEFAELMTKRAKEIGCENTVFKNVSGLHANGAKTLLSDIIKIAVHASSIPGFLEMTSTPRLIIEENGSTRRHIILSRNHLVSSYQTPAYKTAGVTGMNFGGTEEMGECLLASAEYDGKKYFAIIMGGYTDPDGTQVVFNDARKLFDYARNGFKYFEVLKKGVITTQVGVRFNNATDVVTLVPSKTVSMYLPVGTDIKTDITFRTVVPEETIDAPVAQGMQAGEVIVLYLDNEVCRVPLVTTTSVSQSRMLYTLDQLEKFVKRPVVIASFISFFVLLFVFVIVKAVIDGQKKKRKRIR